MAYATIKKSTARQTLVIVELDLDFCQNTFGISPCTASAASGSECFNCLANCQDVPNYTSGTKTYRFSNYRIDELQADDGPPTFPTVTGIRTSPTKLTPAQGLGIRESVSISIQDHPYTDVGVDPYYATRTYTPYEQGSFWGKLLSRNKYYEARELRVKTGYLEEDGTYDATNLLTRHYIIDSISGPTENGSVTITAKDPLKLADREKAQLPSQSQAVLNGDINNSTTTVVITDSNDDVKNSYDAGQTYIRIDDEVMNITNLTGSAGAYTLTVTRASLPSFYSGTVDAEAHEDGATVQHCYEFNNVEIDNIVNYLLDDTAGISASYLPTADWQSVIDYGLQSYTFSTLLTEPEGVKDLLDEITEHSILLWWDSRDQEVKMDSIINRGRDYGPFSDTDNILSGSVSVKRDDSNRISQCWVIYGHRSPVLDLDKIENFSNVKVSADLDAESADQYGVKKVRKIWSRWLANDDSSVASEIANRLLNYYSTTKKIVTITMDPKDDDVWSGDLITVATRLIQDDTGANPELGYRVLEAMEQIGSVDVKYNYTLQSTDQDLLRVGLIGPNTLNDYSSESDANLNRYAFIAQNTNDFADGTDAYTIV